jgi:hypothetical protein
MRCVLDDIVDPLHDPSCRKMNVMLNKKYVRDMIRDEGLRRKSRMSHFGGMNEKYFSRRK